MPTSAGHPRAMAREMMGSDMDAIGFLSFDSVG
jgi:hypothetical protein